MGNSLYTAAHGVGFSGMVCPGTLPASKQEGRRKAKHTLVDSVSPGSIPLLDTCL